MSEMSGAIEIRPANRSDLAILLSLYRELGESEALTPDRLEYLLDRLHSYPDYKVWIASIDGLACGTFALLIADTLGSRCAPAAIVEDVVVARTHRRRGVASSMMRFALEEARRTGCYKLTLSSNLKREDAHRFYESLGFEVHGYSYRADL